MAGKPRKSSVALAAREKARERAEAITRRNEELIALAADYFVEIDRIEAIDDETERKIEELRAKSRQSTRDARVKAGGVVRDMLATGESKKGVAERLGITSAEVTRLAGTAEPERAESAPEGVSSDA